MLLVPMYRRVLLHDRQPRPLRATRNLVPILDPILLELRIASRRRTATLLAASVRLTPRMEVPANRSSQRLTRQAA